MSRRHITALLAAGLLALVAGCGGGDDLAPQVPGPPADVAIQESEQSPAEAATAQTQDEDGDAQTDDETADPDAGGDTGATTTPDDTGAPATGDTGATTPDDGGGTAAPETDADGPTNDTPPPDGSNAEQFEDFCAQNPGAC